MGVQETYELVKREIENRKDGDIVSVSVEYLRKLIYLIDSQKREE